MLETQEENLRDAGMCPHGNFFSSCPSCVIERSSRQERLRTHLTEYLGLKTPEDAERIMFVRGAELPDEYGDQYRFLDDERLADVMVAVVPDEFWVKGAQPSESSAERGLINVRGGYFEGREESERDPSAWMTHELAHCQRYLDKKEAYAKDSETPAFDDIGTGTYPNNKVEEHAFGTQFTYLKSKGVERAKVAELLKKDYDEKDFEFLDKMLDRVYGA